MTREPIVGCPGGELGLGRGCGAAVGRSLDAVAGLAVGVAGGLGLVEETLAGAGLIVAVEGAGGQAEEGDLVGGEVQDRAGGAWRDFVPDAGLEVAVGGEGDEPPVPVDNPDGGPAVGDADDGLVGLGGRLAAEV